MSAEGSVDDLVKNLESSQLDKDGNPLSKNALKKLEKEAKKAQKKAEIAERAATQQQQDEEDYAADKYGRLPINQSQTRTNTKYYTVNELANFVGSTISLRARVHNTRAKGKQAFLVLRQRSSTIQGLLSVDKDKRLISKQMVKFAGR
jgi:aspartyl-tRNA synthetase